MKEIKKEIIKFGSTRLRGSLEGIAYVSLFIFEFLVKSESLCRRVSRRFVMVWPSLFCSSRILARACEGQNEEIRGPWKFVRDGATKMSTT